MNVIVYAKQFQEQASVFLTGEAVSLRAGIGNCPLPFFKSRAADTFKLLSLYCILLNYGYLFSSAVPNIMWASQVTEINKNVAWDLL